MKTLDRSLLFITAALVVGGFFIFVSASLGLLAREGARFSSVAFSQIFFGMVLGTIALLVLARIRYRLWRPYTLYLFIASIFVTLLVFVPGLGKEINGASRWIYLFGFSFQPAELLKLAFILYFASYLSSARPRLAEYRHGLFPLLGFLSLLAGILLLQPDTGTFLVIASAAVCMYLVAGGPWRDIIILGVLGALALSALVMQRDYLQDRIATFLDPGVNIQGTGYQLNQSLIAIGSGQFFGRGFGKSVQKFNYLPEPIGDSIFAVAAEEFGFLGTLTLIVFFLAFAFRGLKIATRAPDYFGGLMVVGIVILIISQSFINIGSMLGVFPLTGVPLVFISHGGTALLFALASVGIVLNVSKYLKK